MNLVEMLQAAGVDGHKADFYLASLELGEATVATIAQKAGIGRTNAYEVLDRLLATGLVATVQKGARSYVIPQDPIALLRRVECQRQVVQDVLPQLRALHNSSGETSSSLLCRCRRYQDCPRRNGRVRNSRASCNHVE